MCSKTQLFKPFQTPLEICADIRTSGVQNDVCVRHTYYYLKYVLIDKAMKSSHLLRPFGNLKFCRFSLLKIKIECYHVSKFRFANSPTAQLSIVYQSEHHSPQPILIFS